MGRLETMAALFDGVSGGKGQLALHKIWRMSGVPWGGGGRGNERAASFQRVWFAHSLLSSVSAGIQQKHPCRIEQVTGLLALGAGSTVTSPTAIPHTTSHWTHFVVIKSFGGKMSAPVSGQALPCLFLKVNAGVGKGRLKKLWFFLCWSSHFVRSSLLQDHFIILFRGGHSHFFHNACKNMTTVRLLVCCGHCYLIVSWYLLTNLHSYFEL